MATNKKTYNVEILEAQGTCDSDMFRLMAQEGDLNATKIKELLGNQVEITGYAVVHITTDEKDFEVMYIDTAEYDLVSAGSEIFRDSVKKYYEKGIRKFALKEIATKKGKTYKATPVLKETTETSDDLPF